MTSSPESTVESLFQQAKSAQDRADYADAAASYKKIVAIRPDLAEAWANLGVMYHLQERYDEAIKSFESALRRNPDLFVPNLFLGMDLLRLGKPGEALGFLKRAQNLNPRDEQANLKLGQAHAALHDYAAANSWYGRAVLLNPENADAIYGLGVTYIDIEENLVKELASVGRDSAFGQMLLAESFLEQGRTNDSIRLYQKVMSAQGKLMGLHAGLGFAFLQNRQLSQAKGEFEAELVESPYFLPARLGLAEVLLEEGKLSQASAELIRIWERDQDYAEASLGGLWQGLNGDQKSEILRTLAASNPNSGLFHYLQTGDGEKSSARRETASGSNDTGFQAAGGPADTHLERQGSPAALYAQGHYTACAQTLLSRVSDLNAGQLLMLARCAFYAGQYRSSFQAAERAARFEDCRPEGLYWQVKSSERLAMSALMQAGLKEPDSDRVHLLLAEAYRKKENYKLSEAEYQQVLKLNPGGLAGHLGLATVYWQKREFEKALPEIQKVLEIDPRDPEANYLMGAILVGRHQYAEGRPHVVLALEAKGTTAQHAHALLGKICAVQGQYNQAIQELNKALSVDRDGSIHIQLYQLYRKVGDQKAAEAALQEAKRLQEQEKENARAVIE